MNPKDNTKGKKEESSTMNPLVQIMDVAEASERWELAPSYIKDLCRLVLESQGLAVKKGKTWILNKNQPNPGNPEHPKNWRAKKARDSVE